MKCARKFVYVLQCAANQKRLRATDLDYTALNGRITDELERIWKEVVVA
jgi:hypothetical protein